jgi:N-acyl-L-homoserine lactone synthetase
MNQDLSMTLWNEKQSVGLVNNSQRKKADDETTRYLIGPGSVQVICGWRLLMLAWPH